MLERWVLYALLGAVLSGLYHVFTKQASGKIPDVVGGFWLEVTAIVGMAVYMLLTRQPAWGAGVTRPGVLYSVAGGACVGVATVLGFVIYRLQGPLSAAAPIVMLGALLVTVLVGILALGETMSLTRGAGIVLAAVAIYLLAK